MKEPAWLTVEHVIALHGEHLAIFGGPNGVRDAGLLSSAVGRPLNQWAYGERDGARLAAAYAFGIVKNHAFIDGNKRTGFAAMVTFLRVNGIGFAPPPPEATAAILSLAAGELAEPQLAGWIRSHWPESSSFTLGGRA